MESELAVSVEFLKTHLFDATRILEGCPLEEISNFLGLMPSSLAADVIAAMETSIAVGSLEIMEVKYAASIMEKLSPRIAAVLLRAMAVAPRENLLNLMQSDAVHPIRLVLSYPTGTAGAHMNPRILTLPDDIIVRDAMKRLKQHAKLSGDYIYVINRSRVFMGFIRALDLLFAKANDPISVIARGDIHKLSPGMNYVAILKEKAWLKFHELPVIDDRGVLLGVFDYPTLGAMESDFKKTMKLSPEITAGASLGELYWIGLSGLFKGMASSVKSDRALVDH